MFVMRCSLLIYSQYGATVMNCPMIKTKPFNLKNQSLS
ncbi:hypothetical protein PPEP_a2404 [Pseudoalteromonas peptidolytica F12-50-A1]|uniref:Uncharacterized protein n=1 Tax=Pseudoalteromonas peptidolytica F12-50-A1 TaxID=1315280 RepID=A0A8I0MS30_9GAMM|nr:hypothetical protein [Pseudoalteromonas peptidolytica F12-50-A1]